MTPATKTIPIATTTTTPTGKSAYAGVLKGGEIADPWHWVARAGWYAQILYHMLGKDRFGQWHAPDPRFLAGFNWRVPPTKLASLWRNLSMNDPGEPSRNAFDNLTDGPVIDVDRDSDFRRWSPSKGIYPLATDRLTWPKVSYLIWLGGPRPNKAFMASAARSAGRNVAGPNEPGIDFVLFTDTPRQDFESARDPALRAIDPHFREVWEMLQWANGADGWGDDQPYRVHLLNVDEVFNKELLEQIGDILGDSRLGMLINAAYVLYRQAVQRTDKDGMAAASDILRVLLMLIFGGLYSDGDNAMQVVSAAAVRRVLTGKPGFAVPNTNNSAFLAAAGHPQFRLMLEDLIYAAAENRYAARSTARLTRWRCDHTSVGTDGAGLSASSVDRPCPTSPASSMCQPTPPPVLLISIPSATPCPSCRR